MTPSRSWVALANEALVGGRRIRTIALGMLAALMCAATYLVVARWHAWPLDLAPNFLPYLLLPSFACLLLSASLRRWAFAGVFGVMTTIVGAAYLAIPFDSANAPDSPHPLNVVWANVRNDPKAMDGALRYAEARAADIVLLGEFPVDQDVGKDFASGYAYQLDTREVGETLFTTRVVALSRLPMAEPQVVSAPGSVRPFLKFGIEQQDGHMLTVIAIHASPPFTAALSNDRDMLLAHLSGVASSPFLLAGDFNATPWTSAYQQAPGRRIGDPRFSRTWRGTRANIGLVIDHMNVSTNVVASAFEVGPDIESDHLPLFARIQVTDGP